MLTRLPNRIKNYGISPESPSAELLTLGRIYSEIGAYASSASDRKNLTFAGACDHRLHNVVVELTRRGVISSIEDLHEIPADGCGKENFAEMSIDTLYTLYRQWPLRHQARLEEGREHLTYYYEGRIVSELNSRKASTKAEQLKIDYCSFAYQAELENLSSIISKPIVVNRNKLEPDCRREHSPAELTALIRLYSDYRDVTEREILVEYVDYALDIIDSTDDKASVLALAAELVELARRKIVVVPQRVTDFLADAIEDTAIPDVRKVMPMLTLELITGDRTLSRKAQRIINRCYKACQEKPSVDEIYTAIVCCEYVSRFSARKMVAVLNDFIKNKLTETLSLTTTQISRLLEAASELAPYAKTSEAAKTALLNILAERSKQQDLEARAYCELYEA